MVDEMIAFEKWMWERAISDKKGESYKEADRRFEKWLIDEKIKENIKKNPSMYRGRK